MLVGHLRTEIAGVQGTEAAALDVEQPLSEIGLDSLSAIELRNRILSRLGVSLSISAILDCPSIRETATLILERLLNSDTTTGSNRMSPESEFEEGEID